MKTLHLSWNDFDDTVRWMAEQVYGAAPISGIYGLPRGGLPLAVALSHRLSLPLLAAPSPGSIVVDDVYETGRTMAPFIDRKDIIRLIWVSKCSSPESIHARSFAPNDCWIVFPWEQSNLDAITRDHDAYSVARANR